MNRGCFVWRGTVIENFFSVGKAGLGPGPSAALRNGAIILIGLCSLAVAQTTLFGRALSHQANLLAP